MKDKGLIIIPYAYGGNTGASIQNIKGQKEIYMKNICTAALSAIHNSGDVADIMVVSNIDLPPYYQNLLEAKGVIIEKKPFSDFNFGTETKDGKVVRWQLAFYKLCAIKYCITKYNYEYFAFLDSDVFVQGSFKPIWEEAQYNIMLYDLNEPVDGYMVKEMQDFLKTKKFLTHYGGEFFAASKELSFGFVNECLGVFDQMIAVNFVTTSGDEFITSIAAFRLKPLVKNSASYVSRYWTGSYRLMCNNYKNIIVLHMPAEKEQGILRLFNKYIKKNIMPSKQAVWRVCHLNKQSYRVIIGTVARKLRFAR